MVRIDRVVTRGGDGGQTSLGDGARVAKDDLRVEAYGTVDEANAAIGLLRLHTASDAAADAVLARAQNDLFDIGADCASMRQCRCVTSKPSAISTRRCHRWKASCCQAAARAPRMRTWRAPWSGGLNGGW